MERRIKNTFSDTWVGSDEQLLIQITVVFYDDDGDPLVSVSIFYTDPYTRNRLLLWQDGELPLFEVVFINYNPAHAPYTITGTLTAKIIKQVTHNDFVIWADIKYGTPQQPYDEFIGSVFFVELPKDIIPPPGPIPGPDDDDIIEPDYPIIYEQPHRDLFPFTYMHIWPEPLDAAVELNFVSYTPYTSSPPVSPFYDTLCALKAAGDRYGMEEAAVDFINNSDAFVKSVALLENPMDCFNSAVIITLRNNSYTEFVPLVCLEANMTPEALTEYLCSAQYLETKERVWLSYFALVILPGYRNRLLNNLTRTLQACHTLEMLLLNSPPEAIDNPVPIHMMLVASIILPDDVFPVPFAITIEPTTVSPPATNTGAVEPYAIGDLQLVRQKLLRYQSGEIANIINVMPGEKKNIERRKLNQYTEKTLEGAETDKDNTDFETESNENFEKEVSKTLADYTRTYNYTNLESTYGPPTNINVNGSYTVSRSGETPETQDISTFAKKILNSTTQRVAEKVYRSRYQSTKNEYEESEASEFVNSSPTQNLLGIYYWLNKVYLAEVINYGNRFILGVNVANPAQNYIIQSYNLAGNYLEEPKPPVSFGIYTFNDVTPENYAALCAYYRITDIVQPPPGKAIVSGSLTGSENKLLNIPIGYYASTADVTYVLLQSSGTFSVQVVLGKNQISVDHPQSDVISNIPMNNENISVPFAASSYYTIASPPDTPPSFIVSTEITCLVSDEKLNEWRINIYQKIMAGYEKLRAEYYSNFSAKNQETETANPAKNRLTIREELKKQCMIQLMEYAGQNLYYGNSGTTGGQLSPPFEAPDFARYEQFFSQAFEWAEMTYTFIENFAPTGPQTHSTLSFSLGDNFFTAFLQAKGARVYLPAVPAFNYRVVFFLATGAIWTADEPLAPLLSSQINLVCELKKVFNTPHVRIEKILDSWEIIVPTSLQVLNNTKIPVI